MLKQLSYPKPMDSFFNAPEPDIEIIERAATLHTLVRSHAQEGDETRRTSDEVVKALHEAGLLHIAVPKRIGGLGANFRTLVDSVAEVSRADGGAGWVMALLNNCTWFTTLFPEQAQKEVFGDGQQTKVCGIFSLAGQNDRVDGGYRVTGEWWYASASLHADWALLGIKLGENADGSPKVGLGLVPMSQVTIRDTWFVAGMRGSGSHTIVAKDVFIPDHRIMSYDDLCAEKYGHTGSEEANDHASFMPVATLILCAAQLGLARAAIDLTLEKSATKSVTYTTFTQAKDSPAHQIKLAEAVCDADAAYMLVARACADIDAAAAYRQKLDPVVRARVRMDTGHSAKLCRDAINRLLSVGGAGAFASSNHLQRVWRDSEVASRHGFVLPEMASLVYGRALFGIEDIIQAY